MIDEKILAKSSCSRIGLKNLARHLNSDKLEQIVAMKEKEDSLAAQNLERRLAKEAKSIVFIFDEKTASIYNITDAIECSQRYHDKVIVCILLETFSFHMLRPLDTIVKVIEANGGNVFTSTEKTAEFINSQY